MYQGCEADISGFNAGQGERTQDHLVVNTPGGGALSIVTYGTSLQSGSPGALIQLRNLDTGVTVRGIIQSDGSVRIQNG